MWQSGESQALLWSAPGPFGTELAKAFLVEQRRVSSPALRRAIDDVADLIELYEAVAELPSVDMSCQLRLPRVLSPELQRLRSAIADDDGDEIQQALPHALAQVDIVLVRAELARAVIALREAGGSPKRWPPPRCWISTVMPMRWCARRSSPRLAWIVAQDAHRRGWCWSAELPIWAPSAARRESGVHTMAPVMS